MSPHYGCFLPRSERNSWMVQYWISSWLTGSLEGGAIHHFSGTTGVAGAVTTAVIAWNMPGIMNGISCCHGKAFGMIDVEFRVSASFAPSDGGL